MKKNSFNNTYHNNFCGQEQMLEIESEKFNNNLINNKGEINMIEDYNMQETNSKKEQQIATSFETMWQSAVSDKHVIKDHLYLQKKKVLSHGIRLLEKEDRLIIPLYDKSSNIMGLQLIVSDGKKKFESGTNKKGNFFFMGDYNDYDTVIICEGYATGASIYEAINIPVIVAFDAGNLEPVAAKLISLYPNKRFIICGDDDCYKEKNVGRESAEYAAQKHGCYTAFPVFEDKSKNNKPTDFNDLHVLEGVDALKAQLEQIIIDAEKFYEEKPKYKLPDSFQLKEDGLYDCGEWISSRLEILAYTKDMKGKNWGKLIKLRDPHGKDHTIIILNEWFGGNGSEIYKALLSPGLKINTKKGYKSKVLEYIQKCDPDKTLISVNRLGWNNGYFILPNEKTIPYSNAFYLDNSFSYNGFGESGTLKDWQTNVAWPCRDNSRLVFAIACALAPVLMNFTNERTTIYNLVGSSSIGKSTALAVAASVWGNSNYIKQWRTTDNALEYIAASHNHCLLCLDELGQVDGRYLDEIIYMLANGSGKSRMNKDGYNKDILLWANIILSTGEMNIAGKLSECNKSIRGGMLNRMIDIPAEATKEFGILNNLHEFNISKDLIDYLQEETKKYYGTPIIHFITKIQKLLQESDSITIKNIIGGRKKTFLKYYENKNLDKQVRKVADSFAFIAAAGEVAIDLKTLPYNSGEVNLCVRECFESWLNERGTSGSYESDAGYKQAISFLERCHSSRFATLNNSDIEEKIINQAGFKEKDDQYWYYYIYSEVFTKEVCQGFDKNIVCQELIHKDMLVHDNDTYQKTKRLPIGLKKVYCIRISLQGDEDNIS